MTDRQTIIAMLTRAKIPFVESFTEATDLVEIERGYAGFFSTFIFNKDGSLKDLRAEES